jgi:hypothetical protein
VDSLYPDGTLRHPLPDQQYQRLEQSVINSGRHPSHKSYLLGLDALYTNGVWLRGPDHLSLLADDVSGPVRTGTRREELQERLIFLVC